jgi:hypothetical protein
MGLKDWLGLGDKKKDEFREKVKEAVADGKLTPQKVAELEAARKELEVEDPSEDRTRFRREAYNEAVSAVKAGGKLTETEAKDLARIQKFLALSDEQIEKTKWDLVRLKAFTDIREGRLPIVSNTHAALRGLKLAEGEVPHYCVVGEIYDVGDPGEARGVRYARGTPYELGSGSNHEMPLKQALLQDKGQFIMTNHRFIFKAEGHTYQFAVQGTDHLHFYRDGMRIKRPKGYALIRFQSEGVVDVVGALVTHFV